jgi:hypothetical protein
MQFGALAAPWLADVGRTTAFRRSSREIVDAERRPI